MTNAAVESERWRREWRVSPPSGWEAIADLCGNLFADLDRLTERIDTAVTLEVPEFRGEGAFSPREMEWSTKRSTSDFLRGVAENRTPTDEELALRALIGQRSAVRQFPLQPLIASFQVGFREVWSELVETATVAGGSAPELLLGAGTTIWRWMLATTNAIAEGYQEELSRREAIEVRTAARFVDSLERDPASDESRALASGLGLKIEGTFRALALVGPVTSLDTARVVVSAIQQRSGYAFTAPRSHSAVIIVQGIDDEGLRASIDILPMDTALGVGGEFPGLEGARSSMMEAGRALELAIIRKKVCYFDEDWLTAVILSNRSSIERLLSSAGAVATANTHLADAVRYFATFGFSVAESARQLGVSQNSFRYRLNRWRSLTGWDPWTHEGLARSMVAIEVQAGIATTT